MWISLDFYGYPCIDLLWILDPGVPRGGIEPTQVPLLILKDKYCCIRVNFEI